VPRKIEVERRKREFASKDLASLLLEAAQLTPADLLPAGPFRVEVSRPPTPRGGFLPLEFFDDTEHDARTPEEWVSLGLDDNGDMLGVPARALACLDTSGNTFAWQECKVVTYDAQKQLYSLRFKQGGHEAAYPRLLVMFQSEDPVVFAHRLLAAHRLRAETEVGFCNVLGSAHRRAPLRVLGRGRRNGL
jgi:dynein heavy chain